MILTVVSIFSYSKIVVQSLKTWSIKYLYMSYTTCLYLHVYHSIGTYTFTCTSIGTTLVFSHCNFAIGLGKPLKHIAAYLNQASSFVYCAFEAKFLLWSFTATPTSVFAYAHFCNLNVWRVCHRKVEAVLLAVSAYFFSQAMLTGTRLVLIIKQ